MKVLICQLRNHGDIIRTFPLIEAIKASYPGTFIGFTCFEEMVETAELCKDIDEIIIQPRLMPVEAHVDFTRICNCELLESVVHVVRNKRYDVYIDLHGVFQSAVFGCLTGIQTRVGRSKHTAKDGAELFYSHVAQIEEKEINRMERHFLIAQRYFEELAPVYNNSYDSYKKYQVAIIPGSSRKGLLKRWGTDNYLELVTKLSLEKTVRIMLGPEEIDLYEKFHELENDKIRIDVVSSWPQYIEIFKECCFVVGNDSAALHIAVWKDIPAFMICGPTSFKINAVWKFGKGKGIVSDEKCFCKDVWSELCEHEHVCMKRLTADAVIKEIGDEMKQIEGTKYEK